MGRLRLVVLVSTVSALSWAGCSSGGSSASIPEDDAGATDGAVVDGTATSDAGTPTADGGAGADAAIADDASADALSDPEDGAVVDAASDATDATVDAGPQCVAGRPSPAPGDDSDGDGVADEDDCDPCDADAHPDASAWHGDARADGSWDWNCNGVDELEYPVKGKCLGAPSCSPTPQGFYEVPPCGGRGELIAGCLSYPYSCGTAYQTTNSTQQRCR